MAENRVALSAESSREGEASTAALQMLVDARKLISSEANWTQRASGRDSHSLSTSATDPGACQFCAYGALVRAYGKYLWQQPGYAELESITVLPVINFNDTHTHAEVLAAFDKAIEATKATAAAHEAVRRG